MMLLLCELVRHLSTLRLQDYEFVSDNNIFQPSSLGPGRLFKRCDLTNIAIPYIKFIQYHDHFSYPYKGNTYFVDAVFILKGGPGLCGTRHGS